MIPSDKFLRMTDLGKLYDVSSHKIGKWLAQIGLRENGNPSSVAYTGGFVKSAANGRNDGYFWVWHATKTVGALEQAGHRRTDQPILTDRLVGPFESRRNGGDGYEIVSGDGTVAVWVRGEHIAETVVKLLNLGFKYGNLN
jgi:hypothetical protein